MRPPFRAFCCAVLALFVAHARAAQQDPSRIPILEPGDVESLREHYGKRVYVMGTVSSAAWSRTGKVMNIEFKGAEKRGLLAVVFENRRQRFDDAWAGDFIKTITAKRVRLYGEINEYGGYDEAFKGRPQMILDSPEQVTLPPEDEQQEAPAEDKRAD